MTITNNTDREMLTAEKVHDMTGVPISTLHDWAAKRERGIDAPGPHHIRLSIGIVGGRVAMSSSGSNPHASNPESRETASQRGLPLWMRDRSYPQSRR